MKVYIQTNCVMKLGSPPIDLIAHSVLKPFYQDETIDDEYLLRISNSKHVAWEIYKKPSMLNMFRCLCRIYSNEDLENILINLGLPKEQILMFYLKYGKK